jgi:hypothetical protein
MSGRGKSLKSLKLIAAAINILREIQPCSIRAVCYRLFVLGILDSMAKSETGKVSTQLTDARERGLIPWHHIVDETRKAERVNAFTNPDEFVEVVKRAYRKDRWTDQAAWVEVWSEKGTIRGTLAPVLDDYGVTFRVMHGYGSATTIHQIAVETQRAGKRLTALYVGDWDPSGLSMSAQDLPQRLTRYGANVDLLRVALVEEDTHTLPSFQADTKLKDPRYRWFIARYGVRCWELDALSPAVLRDRIEQAIRERIDFDAWDRAGVTEAAETDSLASILTTWPTSISGLAPKYSEGAE